MNNLSPPDWKPGSSGPNPDLVGPLQVVIARRDLFALTAAVGGGLVLTACGSSSKRGPVTAVSSGAGSSDASPAGSAGSAASGTVARVGGAHVAAKQAVTTSDTRRLATEINGSWLGGWLDSAEHSGTSDATVEIDPSTRTARAQLSFTGPLLGSAVPAQTYDIDLLSFLLTASTYAIDSPQFGRVIITPDGATSATARATSIPGHPEIKNVQVSASRRAGRVDLTYALSYTDGHTVNGSMALAMGGVRAQPRPLPTPGGAPNPGAVASGAYAAGLLTASQVSDIMGADFGQPQPNGGRLFYAAGIDVSNADSIGRNETVYYRVDLARTAASMAAFWKTELIGQPNITGTWKAAFWLPSIQSLYVYATETRGLLIQVTPNVGRPAPSPARRAEWKGLSERLASKIIASLGH